MGHIWLIGMMGAGKSTVGERLAEGLQMPFIDVDSLVMSQAAKSIDRLFDEGEQVFRDHESAAIRAAASGSASVIATGGGAVLDAGNVSVMRTTGTTVFLQATTDALVERLTSSTETRPLLGGVEDVVAIARARQAIYRDAADITVDTTGKTIDDVVNEVIQCVGT